MFSTGLSTATSNNGRTAWLVRRSDLDQSMIESLATQATYLDEHGDDGVAFTEHHLHFKSAEAATNPIMIDLSLGM